MSDEEKYRLDKILEIRDNMEKDEAINALIAKIILATKVKDDGSIFITLKLNFKTETDTNLFMEEINEIIGESCGVII